MAAASSAFALVTHGGGTHTCAAAVLGLLLRELSPSTPAIAVVFNASAAARNILTAVGLHVHDAGRFRSERYRVPGRPGWIAGGGRPGTLTFPVTLSRHGMVTLSYLQTWRAEGEVRVTSAGTRA